MNFLFFVKWRVPFHASNQPILGKQINKRNQRFFFYISLLFCSILFVLSFHILLTFEGGYYYNKYNSITMLHYFRNHLIYKSVMQISYRVQYPSIAFNQREKDKHCSSVVCYILFSQLFRYFAYWFNRYSCKQTVHTLDTNNKFYFFVNLKFSWFVFNIS